MTATSPSKPESSDPVIVHATTVALAGRAVVIRGGAGRGKSSLALQLIALGARLVADDRTLLRRAGATVKADCPPAISGRIEARGAGLLTVPAAGPMPVALVVDLDADADARLPDPRTCDLLGVATPLLSSLAGPHLAATVAAMLRFGPPINPSEPMPSDPDASTMPDKPLTTVDAPRGKLVLVTGPSGAGRSTAIAALEDLGFEAIDNLPLSLLPPLLSGVSHDRPLALGIDVRTRGFSTERFLETLDGIAAQPRFEVDALYLDARPEVLQRRYSETRRRHPLAPSEAPEEGIEREMDLLAPIRARADVLIDTSELSPHDLRAEIVRLFGRNGHPRMSVTIQSFSYKRGTPQGVDMVFDVRFLQNPHWVTELRGLTGLDPRVRAHVVADSRFEGFRARLCGLVQFLLPAYAEEGKAHLSIGLGCTGGRHRSVVLAEILAGVLAEAGWPVSIRHRELERRASEPGSPPITGEGPA